MKLEDEILKKVSYILEFLGKTSNETQEAYYKAFTHREMMQIDLDVIGNVIIHWIYYAFENSEIRSHVDNQRNEDETKILRYMLKKSLHEAIDAGFKLLEEQAIKATMHDNRESLQ